MNAVAFRRIIYVLFFCYLEYFTSGTKLVDGFSSNYCKFSIVFCEVCISYLQP